MTKPIYEEYLDGFRYLRWSDSGPTIHLAHATGLCAAAYDKFAGYFSDKYTVIGLDSRGHGRTTAVANPAQMTSWDTLYADMLSFFRSLNRPLIAIGHSMGGTVSAVIAARYPGLVSKLILIEPGFMPPFWRPFVYFVQKTGLFRFVPFVTNVTGRKKTWKSRNVAREELHANGPFKFWRKDILEDYIDGGMNTLPDGSYTLSCNPKWEGRILAMAPCGIYNEISSIRCPTLVIYGGKSKTFLPSVAKKTAAAIPGVSLTKMQDNGHFIPMEAPETLADVIQEFILHKNPSTNPNRPESMKY